MSTITADLALLNQLFVLADLPSIGDIVITIRSVFDN